MPTASADASKPGTEHFDLSSDEEDVPEKFRSQPASSSSVSASSFHLCQTKKIVFRNSPKNEKEEKERECVCESG